MTIDRPRLLSSSLNLWDRKRTLFLNAFALALRKLQSNKNLPKEENEINRLLYFFLLEAIHEIDPNERIYSTPPILEANNPPDPDDVTRATRELKRPDFQWGYRDIHAEQIGSRYMAKTLVVECKRLGFPDPANWVLNDNYVRNGIIRFIDKNHGYGQSSPSGVMIGYVQTMELPDILDEVNLHCRNNSITIIVLNSNGWQTDDISRLEHSFIRQYPVSPFNLFHLWSDLRKCYPRQVPRTSKGISKQNRSGSKKKKK